MKVAGIFYRCRFVELYLCAGFQKRKRVIFIYPNISKIILKPTGIELNFFVTEDDFLSFYNRLSHNQERKTFLRDFCC